MRILSIDAWGNKKDGYNWNNWFNIGNITKPEFETLKSDKAVATWFMDNGFTCTNDMRKISIDDDGYNLVLTERKRACPIFVIEYGPEY